MVLLAIEGEDRQIAITTDELDARNVVGFALEGDGLLRAVGDVVDMYGDLGVRGTRFGILIGISPWVLGRTVDRHTIFIDPALIGADEG